MAITETSPPPGWKSALSEGRVIPASPLALFADGTWSERHQRALLRYYVAAGAGGIAVGVHTTQFAIRDPQHDLYEPLLRLTAAGLDEQLPADSPFIRIAGVCGRREQALREAETAAALGYHAALVSLTALGDQPESALVDHLAAVASRIPVIGFYLQPSVGGRVLSYRFWRQVCEIERLVAIKMAPFNRYQTWDVIRAVIDAGRLDVALYTGNDDNIIVDLLTRWEWAGTSRRIVGGLLGQWAVGTRAAALMLDDIRRDRELDAIPSVWLTRNARLTDLNAALFDAAHGFRGCIAGINECLRRDGLLPSARCLDPAETLSPGQSDELDRVSAACPELLDTAFIRDNLASWLG